MLKKQLLWVVLASWSSYSYSESISPYYGQTGNAAAGGYTWDMNNILPLGVPGLDINTVIYRYTPYKTPEDAMKVHIQNENALGSGYIFRETDDWTGQPGGVEIRKAVPVIPGIPREAWGTGSVAVEGTGTVEDASVIYTYKADPCYDPQYSPNCPGYVTPMPDIPEVDVSSLYNVLDDENVNLDNETDLSLIEDTEDISEEDNNESEEDARRKIRLESAMSAIDNAILIAETQRISMMNAASNAALVSSSYYATIPGGAYKDSVVLNDKKLPENKKGLRNGLAQQLLHNKMIEAQYRK